MLFLNELYLIVFPRIISKSVSKNFWSFILKFILGIDEVDIIETEEQTKLKTIYDQLQLAKERLEDRDIECLELKRKLDFEYNQKNHTDNQMKALLIKILVEHQSNQKVPRLSKQSAFVFFNYALRQVKQLNYDKDIIALLLDAKSALLSTRVRDSVEIQFKALLFENQRLRDSLFQFQIANAQLQILNAFDSPEFQKKFIESLKSLVQGQRAQGTCTIVHSVQKETQTFE